MTISDSIRIDNPVRVGDAWVKTAIGTVFSSIPCVVPLVGAGHRWQVYVAIDCGFILCELAIVCAEVLAFVRWSENRPKPPPIRIAIPSLERIIVQHKSRPTQDLAETIAGTLRKAIRDSMCASAFLLLAADFFFWLAGAVGMRLGLTEARSNWAAGPFGVALTAAYIGLFSFQGLLANIFVLWDHHYEMIGKFAGIKEWVSRYPVLQKATFLLFGAFQWTGFIRSELTRFGMSESEANSVLLQIKSKFGWGRSLVGAAGRT